MARRNLLVPYLGLTDAFLEAGVLLIRFSACRPNVFHGRSQWSSLRSHAGQTAIIPADAIATRVELSSYTIKISLIDHTVIPSEGVEDHWRKAPYIASELVYCWISTGEMEKEPDEPDRLFGLYQRSPQRKASMQPKIKIAGGELL